MKVEAINLSSKQKLCVHDSVDGLFTIEQGTEGHFYRGFLLV